MRSLLAASAAVFAVGLLSRCHGAVIQGPVTNPTNGHVYYLLETTSWTASEAESQSLGGHLVTINDEAENNWVTTTFGANRNLWIGFFQPPGSPEPSGGWKWSSDEPVTYVNWDRGEPNGYGSENHAEIWGNINDLSDPNRHRGRWNDSRIEGPAVFGVTEVKSLVKDYNGNGQLDVDDLDLQAKAILTGKPLDPYDFNADGAVNYTDRELWIHDAKNTYIGDANLDGEFNSNDFVQVFGAGTYESGKYARWAEGDWNGDLVFNTNDFVVAFQDGGYELGPRVDVASVPEPAGLVLLALGLLAAMRARRWGPVA